MTLRQLLERASDQLAELHNEHGERFDLALNIVRRAHELALEHHSPDAAKIVENVTRPLNPNAGRRLLAAMIASLPSEKSDTLNPPQIARRLKVSPDTVLNWVRTGQLKASNIATGKRPRWIIKRSDLDMFLQSRQPHPQATVRKRRNGGFKKYRD